ncbi:MAG: hypothetical protein MSC30_14895 [Gaiellaceae bacterium MAG52_C11]|nr:hypothetical protein [Candidatus Gaiellasilicea maunaloa]
MIVAIENPGLEATLKEVPDPVVAAVESHRVEAVQPMHPGRELRLRRPDDEMEVVRHQRPDEHAPAEAQPDLPELPPPVIAVTSIQDDRLPRDPACGDVVDRWCREVGSSSAWHVSRR